MTTTAEANAGANGHVGASRKTNNTAELQVIIEALLFLLAQVDAQRPMIDFHSHIIIHTDSKYACGIIRDGAKTDTDETMVNIMAHLWKKTRLAYDLRMVWVRGHSDNVGNELADPTAAHGASEAINAERWHWRPRDWDYWEFRRDYPASFANQLSDFSFHHSGDLANLSEDGSRRLEKKRHFMKTTEEKDDNVNERAEIRRGQKGAPRILELQNAISDAAKACGKACRVYTSPSPRDRQKPRKPSSA